MPEQNHPNEETEINKMAEEIADEALNGTEPAAAETPADPDAPAGTVTPAKDSSEKQKKTKKNAKSKKQGAAKTSPEKTEPEADSAETKNDIAAADEKPSENAEKAVAVEETASAPSVDADSKAEPAAANTDEADFDDDDDDYDFFAKSRKNAKKRAKKRKKRKKGRGISCALIWLTFLLSISVASAVLILAVAKEMYGIDKDVTEKIINIETGSTTADIAQQLERENMIRLPKLFQIISRLNGKDGSYIAGEHVLKPSMSYETMIAELCKNYVDKREYVKVTFPEGTTLLRAAEILEENEVCSASDFRFYFNAGGYGYKFEEYLPEASALKFQAREGYCFPDTYEFYVDEDPQIVVQKIYANFDAKFTASDYRAMENLGMTLDEVITLASIVQGEAPFSESMKMVASVFHNRLNNPAVFQRLESDPTRKYAEEVIAPNLDIKNEVMCDAYNTYVGNGLPPGAINNPGKDAISAVLHPAESNYYFFCANVDTMEIFYAVDNDTHNANLAKIKQQQAEARANG